jgi:hypothetical protein
MRNFSPGRFQEQIRLLRRQFLQESALRLSDLPSDEIVKKALAAE